MNLKKFGKALMSKSVGTGSSSSEKRIYRATVSQRLRSTVLGKRKWKTQKLLDAKCLKERDCLEDQGVVEMIILK